MLKSLLACSLFSLLLITSAVASPICGGAVACQVADGDYRIELPADGDVRGAYVFFHGYKSSAELQMNQRTLVETTLAHHMAYVAVDGVDGSWSFPDSVHSGRDEKSFIGSVFQSLDDQFGFTSDNTVIGGFSIGASMAFYTACEQGERASAMVTFAGVFWDPLPSPTDCVADLPPVIHFHGTADRTFPLEGRAIGTEFHQGDARGSMAVLRSRAACSVEKVERVKLDNIDCEKVPGCVRGDSIMCIHQGGHVAEAHMLDAALTSVGFPR